MDGHNAAAAAAACTQTTSTSYGFSEFSLVLATSIELASLLLVLGLYGCRQTSETRKEHQLF